MSKKQSFEPLSEEEILLFRNAMKKMQPIKRDRKALLKKKPIIKPNIDYLAEDKYPSILSDHLIEKTVAPEDSLFFSRNGLSPKQIRQLKQGKVTILGTLDLHGFDSESAREKLIQFLQFAYRNNKRCISIIHGKGHSDKPILKNKINNWLRQFDIVLAFCTALPKHGGTGALYVLLKSRRHARSRNSQ